MRRRRYFYEPVFGPVGVDALQVLRAAVAIGLLAWLPGYAWTRALIPRLTRVERFVLSVTLSVALVTLALFLGNVLLGIRVSGAHAVWYSLFFTAVALVPATARFLDARLGRVSD